MTQAQRNPNTVADSRIDWALNNPVVSDWLKNALKSALDVDPIIIQNDVELLRQLILPRAQMQLDLEICDYE